MSIGVILADDLTGALDTGAELSSRGCKTNVLLDWTADFSCAPEDGVQAVVVSTDSRHLPPEAAYSRVRALCEKARRAGISRFLKKTDSALRGNVGAELSALLDAVNAPILFVPAFPDMNRGMRGGVIYIDGLPVAESIFGKDPFNPVKHSRVEDILHATAGSLPVAVHDVGGAPASPAPGVHAMNASTNEELRLIAESAKQTGITVFAGCAGFARHLPYVWGLAAGGIQIPPLPQRVLVFSGSMNGITTGQLQYGRSMGIPAYTIGGNALSDPAVFPYAEILRALGEGSVVIVEAVSSEEVPPVPAHAPPIGEEARRAAAEGMGEIAARLIRQARGCLPLVIGGDTLLSTMQNLRCQRLYPLQSIATGTVLALADTCLGQVPVVTKSGGLGPLNIMEILLSYIQTGKGE